MAIYRHFKDAAELADAVLAKVLDGLEADIPRAAGWQKRTEAWIRHIYRRLVETPQCAGGLSSGMGTSTAWIRASILLKEILEEGGFRGKALHEATFWITLSTGAFAQQTLAQPIAAHIDDALAAIHRLPPAEFERVASFVPDIPRVFTHSLDIVTERVMASVAAMHAQQQRRRTPG